MQKSREIEQKILENTRLLLQQMSFEEFNMRLLAQSCGVAVGTLYNYYPTKRDLLMAIIEQHSAMLIERIDAAIAPVQTRLDKLMAIYDLLSTAFNQNHKLWMSRMDSFLQEDAKREVAQSSRKVHAEITQAIFARVRDIVGKGSGQADAFVGAFGRLLMSYCLIPANSRDEVQTVFAAMLQGIGE